MHYHLQLCHYTPPRHYTPHPDLSLQVSVPELALLRFVVLDDDYIGDDFIGQYTVALECMQSGYRTVPLLSLSGGPLPKASLFVHLAFTSRQGGAGGGAQRGAGRGRILRHVGIRTLDHALRPAAAPLKEAADLREGMKVSVPVTPHAPPPNFRIPPI